MRLLNKYTVGDYHCYLYEEKIGYTYRIKTRINGKLTTIAQPYVYANTKEIAEERLREKLEVTMGICSLLNLTERENNASK